MERKFGEIPRGCKRYCTTKIPPNKKAAQMARPGFHRANIVRAMAIQPLPAVMPSIHDFEYEIERCAPASPEKPPPIRTLKFRSFDTFTP